MKPTDKQFKKLCEWCGFEEVQYLNTNGREMPGCIHYAHPVATGGGDGSLPPLDINFFFGYVVPKLDGVTIDYQQGHYMVRVKHKGFESVSGGKDLVTALFSAAWEVVEQVSEEFGAIERPKGITFDGVIDSIKAGELPILSDGEVSQLVTDYHFSGVQNRHVLAKNVAQAQRDLILKHIKGEGK